MSIFLTPPFCFASSEYRVEFKRQGDNILARRSWILRQSFEQKSLRNFLSGKGWPYPRKKNVLETSSHRKLFLSQEEISCHRKKFSEEVSSHRKKFLGIGRYFFSQKEILSPGRYLLSQGGNLLSHEEISCQRKKFPVTEEISCDRKKFSQNKSTTMLNLICIGKVATFIIIYNYDLRAPTFLV